MRVLAFDMTARRITVGLAADGQALGRWDTEAGRGRSGAIDELVETALKDTGWSRGDIEGLALVTGPGSLTATRIGWAMVAGWALAANIPVSGWPAYAVQRKWWIVQGEVNRRFGKQAHDFTVACVIHHRGDEFYLYDLSTASVNSPPDNVVLGDWMPDGNTTCILVGSGIIGYRERWLESVGPDAIVVPEDDALVGGDVLATWAEKELASGHALNLLESPLDYGLPPQFRKAV